MFLRARRQVAWWWPDELPPGGKAQTKSDGRQRRRRFSIKLLRSFETTKMDVSQRILPSAKLPTFLENSPSSFEFSLLLRWQLVAFRARWPKPRLHLGQLRRRKQPGGTKLFRQSKLPLADFVALRPVERGR